MTASLDPEMVREVLDVIVELADSGLSMVIVTHEMEFARAVADRIVFLENGHVVEENSPGSVFHDAEDEARRGISQNLYLHTS